MSGTTEIPNKFVCGTTEILNKCVVQSKLQTNLCGTTEIINRCVQICVVQPKPFTKINTSMYGATEILNKLVWYKVNPKQICREILNKFVGSIVGVYVDSTQICGFLQFCEFLDTYADFYANLCVFETILGWILA